MVTDKQVRRLFALVKTEGNQEIAAAKAGMDAKTARKYRRLGQVPSELPAAPRWRTRPDPFVGGVGRGAATAGSQRRAGSQDDF